MGTLRTKRVYEPADASDGFRILVDRLWPRGVSREHAALDEWLKDVAPSPELRTWWDHDPARLDEFARRYRGELGDSAAVGILRQRLDEHDSVTLVYAARDERVNHAAVLRDYLLAESAG